MQNIFWLDKKWHDKSVAYNYGMSLGYNLLSVSSYHYALNDKLKRAYSFLGAA